MLPPAAATTRVTAATMPSRSAPCTLTRYGSPAAPASASGSTARTVASSRPSALSGASAFSTASAAGPVQTRVIAK